MNQNNIPVSKKPSDILTVVTQISSIIDIPRRANADVEILERILNLYLMPLFSCKEKRKNQLEQNTEWAKLQRRERLLDVINPTQAKVVEKKLYTSRSNTTYKH